MAKKSTAAKPAKKSTAAKPDPAPAPAEAAAVESTEQATLPINETFNVYDHPVADIKPRGLRTVSEARIEAIAKSIRINGLQHPITIGTDGVVVDGDTRLAAFKLLGRPTIPVRYAIDAKGKDHLESTDIKAFAQTLVSNLQRTDMTPIEIGKTFADALEKKVVPDAKSLAGLVGMSTAYVSKYLGLVQRGIPALQENLNTGRITAEAATAIIARAKSEADQTAMLTNLLEATDGKITIETVNQIAPPGSQQESEQVTFNARKRGRPAGSASTRVTLPGSCMPESGNVSAQLAKSADGGWAVTLSVVIGHKNKTFAGFDVAKLAQAEIAGIDSAAIRKELETARDRLS